MYPQLPCEHPAPNSPRSRTVTAQPVRARWYAQRLPTTPPPTTIADLPIGLSQQKAHPSRRVGLVGHAFRYFLAVVSGKSSVRNGTAGSPSLLKKFNVGSAKLTHPNRTAVGFGTSALETTTVSPTISAFAGTNFLS